MPAGFGPIPGIQVGHATDERAWTGCTVLLAGAGAVAACEVLGGAAGERELEPLRTGHIVEQVHAVLLTGGSAFGLEAAAGVMRWCEEHGFGFDTGIAHVPIVPAAVIFDLRLGERQRFGAQQRPRHPDADMGYAAARAAAESEGSAVAEGNVGAGTGATVGKLFGLERAMKAGLGCWTEELVGATTAGVRVAALAVVNAFGDVRDPVSGRILAGARTAAEADEFVDTAAALRRGVWRTGFADPNTVLLAIATDARLDKLQAQRVARMAAAGIARAVSPAFSPFDGDVIFVLSTGRLRADVTAVGAAAAEAAARAIVRGVTEARSAAGLPGLKV
ncbi:MAG: P1 family peptidase [Acidobacteriia bacterium]|jgi:L-aminopeptidase/D-esterase-like protein|nr:P1 family peptidase [Terriglobia bacterium]